MPINLPTYEQQQHAITLLQELGVDVDTLLAGRVVKSVQRGTTTLAYNDTDTNIPIATVNPNKSFVIINGVNYLNSIYHFPWVVNLLSDNLVLRIKVGNSTGYTLSWQVIEFY